MFSVGNIVLIVEARWMLTINLGFGD